VEANTELPGTTVRKSDEGKPDIQQHEPQHQRAKGAFASS